MIEIRLDGLCKPALERGVDPSILANVGQDIETAHRELMARRGRDLGFYDTQGDEGTDVGALVTEGKRLRSLSDDLIVLGIGGSSLGGQALTTGLVHHHEYDVRLHYLDNIDPDTLASLLGRLNPSRTTVLVITKSGDTVETLAQFLIVRRWLQSSLGQGERAKRMVFITDPNKGLLRELSQTEGTRCFDVPANIGGRFSALTPVGLLPAAYLGIDIEAVSLGAKDMAARVTHEDANNNPACVFAQGALLAKNQLGASSLVMMPYTDSLRTTSQWFVQLWAESLGKRMNRQGEEIRCGQTPIAAMGVTDQHAQLQLFVDGPRDKVIVLVGVEKSQHTLIIPDELAHREEVAFLHGRDLGDVLNAERRATRAALLNAGVPVMDLSIPAADPGQLGGLLMLLEGACACAGIAMDIDPFDQPGVEAGKRMALGLLGRAGFEADAEQVHAREACAPKID